MEYGVGLGFIIGLPVGFLISYCFFYLNAHKEQVTYDLSIIKSDLQSFHLKLEKLVSSFSKSL